MKSNKLETILWPPHWTCCGKGWNDSCSKKHFHKGVIKSKYKQGKYTNDVSDGVNFQMKFKKIIRPSWVVQINKFHRYNKKTIMKKLNNYVEKNHIKLNVNI